MTGLPLREAFRKMIRRDDAITRLGISSQLLYDYRRRLDLGEYPKDQTMRDMLKKAGWHRAMEERWAF